MQHVQRLPLASKSDQSQRRKQAREQTSHRDSLQTSSPRNNSESSNSSNFKNKVPQMSKMDKFNGIDMEFIYKNGDIPQKQANIALKENNILQPNRTRIVGKGSENERLQQYRPSQQDRKEIERRNILIFNRFFHY